MISINLLDNRRKEIIKRQAMLAKLNLAGFGFLGISVLIIISLIGLKFTFSKRLEESESTGVNLQAQINSFNHIFSAMDHISAKLDSIKTILSSRDLALKKLELFFSLYQSQLLEIRNVGLGGASNPFEFEVSGRVENIGEFVELNNYVSNLALESNEFEQVILRSLSRNNQAQYTFNYLITYKEISKK